MDQRKQILIVDDMEINRAILCELFQKEYMVLEAENGSEALDVIHRYKDRIAVILLDVVMPVMDGFQLMEHLQQEGFLNRIPVILITADTYRDNEIKGLNLGASDIIMKPFDPHIVKKRVENSVELYQHKKHLEDLVDHQTKKLTETNDFIIDALSSVIEYRSLETGQHIRRIRVFTHTLLKQVAADCPQYHLTAQKIRTITSASAMHDIGKIAIPDSILLKPGRLTAEEFEIMKTHTTKGCEILQTFHRMEDKGYLLYCYNICRFHHERWDGRGYPDGLAGDEIPICAQVVAIADVYDALTSARVYKPALSHKEAVEMILAGKCGVFSNRLLTCFLKVQEAFDNIRNTYVDGAEPTEKISIPNLTKEVLKEQEALDAPAASNQYQEASAALQKETLERDDLINAIPGGVAKVAIDDDFRILLASNGFYTLTGYTPAEYHSSPFEGKGIRLILKEDAPHVQEMVLEQINKKLPIFVEYRIRKKDGSIAWINVHGSEMKMENGIAVVQAVFIDCTDTKRTEQKLLSLMNSVPSGIAQINISQAPFISYASDNFYHIFGYTHEEYEQHFPKGHFLESIHWEDRPVLEQKLHCLKQLSELQFSVECRILHRDGQAIWYLIKGVRTQNESDEACCQCVFTDITESRHVQEMLRMNEERYRIIVEQVQDIIFEWDIRSDTMYHSPVFKEKFEYEMPVRHFFDVLPQTDIMHRDDLAAFEDFRIQIMRGKRRIQKEFRIKSRHGDYIWCRVRAKVIQDQNQHPIRVIGTLSDVNDYKQANAILEEKAHIDLLTGLYNKITMESLIEKYLDGAGRNLNHALFIIDIDNFKEVNDTFGHMEGDAVLRDLGTLMQQHFQNNSILGRAGGDELVVFLQDLPHPDAAAERAQELIQLFHDFSRHRKSPLPLSGSIGAALYPEDGADFSALFQKADQALYSSKREGKDQYTFFQKIPEK